MSPRAIRILGAAGKWTGRALALLLLLFWGMFFVEHMKEWFLRTDHQTPPAWVWVSQGLHFLMLVSLAVMLKWDRVGSVLLVIATAAFFGMIFGVHRFPFIALLNLIPIVFFCLYWWAAWSARSAAKP